MPAFHVARFRQDLCTQVLGRAEHYVPEIPSTNTMARTLGRQGAPEGTIVVADAQSAGRGQADRIWISPPELNLYVSIVLKPALTPAQAPLLSLMAAVALVDTLRRKAVSCGIKWPNDVFVGDRKVAGILTEMETDGDHVHFVVVGIGVNVNMTQMALAHYLGPIAQTATSLQIALGHEISREHLLAVLLSDLEQWYDDFCTRGVTILKPAWEERSLMCGRRIHASTADTAWEGTAEGIDHLGRLWIRQDDGSRLSFTSADVRFLD
jgi:BirA family biotin operon repressor/biotin-[acetyl-CoA-carboxylase] ligase